MTILNKIKDMVEADIEETIFDNQLLLYINSGISYLRRNGIPVSKITNKSTLENWKDIEEDDKYTILDWLHLRCIQRFDKSLKTGSKTTNDWIDSELTNLIYQLKAIYLKNP